MQVKTYLKDRVNKIRRMLSDYVDHDLNMFQKIFVLIDLAFSMVVYGVGITDYFQYQFYKRRHIDRKDFIVHRKRMWLVRTFNNKESRKNFDSKAEFNRVFNEYLNRKWLNLSSCSFDEFRKFAGEFQKFLVKPVQGSHGIGIRVQEIDPQVNMEQLFRELKAKQSVIEELIIQNDELSEFNPASVNTLRVVSLLGSDGTARLMTANLRVGRGDRYADNFHYDGIAALVDLKTGLVYTTGIDKNLKRYIVHPVSGKQIIGFKIPFWDKVKEIVKQAAKVVPDVRYVGWDLAISRDGEILLVEGNAAADPDVSQMPDQIGKWPLYRETIEAFK